MTVIPDNINYRRHKGACQHYRERWSCDGETINGEPDRHLLYEIICLQGTPPLSEDEQQKCMCTRRECWRVAEVRKREARRESVA